MTHEEHTAAAGGALVGVLEALAGSRGLALEELPEEARRRGYGFTPEDIFGGNGGFGEAVDAVLGLDDAERTEIVGAMVADWGERRGRGPVGSDVAPPGPVAPGFARFPAPNPRTDGGRWCCVSCPDAGGPCGGPAVMTVWGRYFCEVHGAEAEASALEEMHEEARDEISRIVDAARPRWRENGALLAALRAAQDGAQSLAEARSRAHEEAADAAYGGAPDGRTDSTTLAYNGDDFAATPAAWWGEERRLILRAMRESYEAGLPLTGHLEPLRERATVQEILAVRYELNGFEMPA